MTLTDRLNRFLRGLSGPGSIAVMQTDALRERLFACLPAALQRALARHHRVLIVHAEGGHARLELVAGLESEAVGEIDLLRTSTLPDALTQRTMDQRHATELRLPRHAVLTRAISFPAQVRANLPQVIRYELDRLTPFQPDDVIFDFAAQPGPKNANRLNLELALCRRDILEDWLKRLNELGSPIDRVTWEGAWSGANLLPIERRPHPRAVRLGLSTWMAIIAAVLAVAIVLTPLWQKKQIAEVLDTELGRIRAQAVAVDDLRQELERARQGSTVVLQMKLDQPQFLELLRELTDRLPEDTWIQNLELDGNQVDLRGESGQATALIAILEQAPGIDGVSFKSPVTQIARTGKERFNISFQYVSRRQP
ncbi:PilN domain-containing protein [Thiocystis violacea]|uniref:PilN domain-containing protein n=1 Tax=Thiocystis violacea TaxID=13725 RepID=UPI0019079C51|nr:PilN domain-containing protein [Thiocystis violacea]MBK1722106.1 fimbrial assembly protein [Thiocystis violacea]